MSSDVQQDAVKTLGLALRLLKLGRYELSGNDIGEASTIIEELSLLEKNLAFNEYELLDVAAYIGPAPEEAYDDVPF